MDKFIKSFNDSSDYYYDKNSDGIVDRQKSYYKNIAGHSYSLVDTDLDGYFDVKYRHGCFSSSKEAVYIKVPTGVKLEDLED